MVAFTAKHLGKIEGPMPPACQSPTQPRHLPSYFGQPGLPEGSFQDSQGRGPALAYSRPTLCQPPLLDWLQGRKE